MPKSASPFRDRTIPKVAKRLKVPEHQLRRAAGHGDVRLKLGAGWNLFPRPRKRGWRRCSARFGRRFPRVRWARNPTTPPKRKRPR